MAGLNQPIRVHLASQRPLMRAGLRRFLETAPDIELVGENSEIGQLASHQCLQVLLMDGSRADRRSLVRTIEEVQRQCPATAILVLLAQDEDASLATLLTTDISGVVPDDIDGEALNDAVRQAAQGKVLFTGEQIRRAQRWQAEVQKPWLALTQREREVAALLTQGMDNRSIAAQLALEVRTVEGHVSRLMEKLGVASRAAAVAWMRDHAPGTDRPTRP